MVMRNSAGCVGALVAALAACADDGAATPVDTDDSSSSSSTHDPTTSVTAPDSSGSSSTTSVDSSETSSSSSTGESSSSESSSTGGVENPGPDLRIFYADQSAPDVDVLTVVDLVDGVLGEPVVYFPTEADAVGTLVTERWLIAQELTTPTTMTLLDLETPPPFESHPLALPDSPSVANVFDVVDDRWLISTCCDAVALHVYTIGDDGSASAPWLVDDAHAATAVGGSAIAFVRDGAQVVFRAHDELADTTAIWLAPADEAAPAAATLAEAPGTALYGPSLAPDRQGLVYRTGGTIPASLALHFVDLASDPAGAPIELGALPDTVSIGQVRWAPDSSGVTVLHDHADGTHDLAFIPITDGLPLPPVQLSAGETAGRVVGGGWSRDSRWVSLIASDPYQSFLVRIEDGVASPELPAVAPPLEIDPTIVEFSNDSQHLYLVLDHGPGAAEVVRVSLAGDTPSEPESLMPMLLGVWQLSLSADDGTLFVSGEDPDDDGVRHAWTIDVSGDAAGDPVRIDEDLASEEEVFVGMLTANGSHVAYSVSLPTPLRREAVLDRTSGITYPIADGAPVGSVWLRPLSR